MAAVTACPRQVDTRPPQPRQPVWSQRRLLNVATAMRDGQRREAASLCKLALRGSNAAY